MWETRWIERRERKGEGEDGGQTEKVGKREDVREKERKWRRKDDTK